MSTNHENEGNAAHKVVLNLEDQYSILRVDQTTPPGWRDAGKAGTKTECLAYIKEVWVDMRPLSLRREGT